jgi:mRNA interferase RelE/StbE
MAALPSEYRIFETDGFTRDLERDFSGFREKIKKKLQNFVYHQLRKQPHFGKNIKKLSDYKPDTWRYRIGDFRFFYSVDERQKIVFMLAADNRRDAYK